ncbi:MAG: ribonuclease HII [Thermoplasmatota archaeon]
MAAFAGIDEAGRGPVLGPLVVAGVSGAPLELFSDLGCTDSKRLSPDRRTALDRALRATPGVRVEVRLVGAEELDAERRAGATMNAIEVRRFVEIAKALEAEKVWVDAADVDARRFGRRIREGVKRPLVVVSEHKADLNHPIVGAASIVAKVARDKAVAELARRLERKLPLPLGSGYCSDPLTVAFLAEWVRQFGALPEGTRATWAPARLLTASRTPLESFAAPSSGAP